MIQSNQMNQCAQAIAMMRIKKNSEIKNSKNQKYAKFLLTMKAEMC